MLTLAGVPTAQPPRCSVRQSRQVPGLATQGFQCHRSLLCSAVARQRAKLLIRSAQGQSRTAQGPQPAEEAGGSKPQWVKDLEADAPFDEDLAKLLDGANGDPEVIRQRMRDSMAVKREEIYQDAYGEQKQMDVRFREVDTFNLWIWLEFYKPPSEQEAELLEEVIQSWFMLGRLGAFNGMNLQVYYKGSDDVSYMEYDTEECETALQALFHDIRPLEFNGEWCRTWVNMGTADEIALDMLVNALSTFSRENMGIKQMVVGGDNPDWQIPARTAPKASTTPMRVGPMDPDDY